MTASCKISVGLDFTGPALFLSIINIKKILRRVISLSILFDSNSLIIAEKSLDALSLRQSVISSNLANVDTPGYKSHTVVFEDILKRFLSSSGSSINSSRLNNLQPQIRENKDSSLRDDGNNVDITAEKIELSRTQLQYEYLIRAVSSELSRMKYVINEGR
jgi:flagellar basal-body rod protein FlgB